MFRVRRLASATASSFNSRGTAPALSTTCDEALPSRNSRDMPSFWFSINLRPKCNNSDCSGSDLAAPSRGFERQERRDTQHVLSAHDSTRSVRGYIRWR
jgi:hypothetical protein